VACVRAGLPWTAVRVAQFERGDAAPTLPTLLLVAVALDSVTPPRQRVTLADLVAVEGSVSLAPGVWVPGAALAAVIRGGPASALMSDAIQVAVAGQSAAELSADAEWTRADAKVATELGIDRYTMTKAAAHLWGRSLSAERDARATNARTKGLVTVALTEELRGELASWADGD
jgi:hypothetical protein